MHEKTTDKKHKSFRILSDTKVLGYTLAASGVILLLDIILYFTVLSPSEVLTKCFWWIMYLDISVATIAGALWYYASYKGYTSCMASMMIGMTIGMQTGMMIGAIFGAVNGYFIGAMIGMILGTITGLITGRSSIMGVLQGLMSGLMGGTMGAMITMMMYTDHVLWFMPFYMMINIAILIGFVYMYHDEVIKGNDELIKKEIPLWKFITLTTLSAIILSAIVIYAPKSLLF
jgi:hypothetical protein